MTEALAFHIMRSVQARDFHAVATALKGGADPDCRYAGMRPLHTAVEAGDLEMAAFLLHWGAKPDEILNQNRKTAIMLARELAKDPKSDPMLALLTDEEPRKKVLATLQERLEAENAEIAARKRAALPRQMVFIFVLFMATMLALHGLIMLAPEAAARWIPPKMLSDIQLLSPVLKHPDQIAFQNALLAEQQRQAAAAGGHTEL
mmetsp:Transcript_19064/g.48121  ORF Transcript_19064/g.48121 Transcript_19064/m.48121 type:complete len:204 (+) Transcript_19064:290-901(+)|eukprot:jgi/Tetstr1/455782/TSEL_042579.t1